MQLSRGDERQSLAIIIDEIAYVIDATLPQADLFRA
jgi:hypothetical protein